MAGQTLNVNFNGKTPQLRRLAIKTTLLTLLTLGIYRFWARTRIRKYFWSSLAPGGTPFEYTGKGLEKFLGFLIAVAVLAIYLGLLQLLLSFFSLSALNQDNPAAVVISSFVTSIAIFPLIFYAQYRARRYILSRTRWRGIRFGVDQAAWSYAARAIGHTLITILTLGLLLPRQTFYLEKFKVDRTHYGDAQFAQHGRWQSLYPAMKHVFIGIAGMLACGLLGFNGEWEQVEPGQFDAVDGRALLGIFGGIVFVFWFYIGLVYYSIHAHRYLTAQKSLDGKVTFTSLPRTKTVLWIFIVGGFLAGILASIIAGIIGVPLGFVLAASLGEIAAVVGGLIGYLIFFVALSVCSLIFITQPMIAHYANETQIHNAEHLDEITQRAADEMIEAEGFADALDVGAAI